MLDIKILPIDASVTFNAIGRIGGGQGEMSEASSTKLEVPWHPLLPDQGLFPLLSWHSRVSEFAGRDTEMNRLTEWANAEPKVWVKFVVADGGIGKSRLGGEFAESLQKKDWAAGFVDLHHDLDFTMAKAGTLLVIDYPEERTDKVTELLRDLTFCRPPSPLRVLFLTRQSPDKWEPVIAAANAKTIVDQNHFTLTRLQTQDAKTIYDSTARKSTDYLQRFSDKGHGAEAIPIDAMEAWLKTADVNERALFVMAAAVHCAENPDEEIVNYSGPEIVKALVEREVDRYRRIAISKGLGDEYALARLLAMAAIADAISPDDIKSMLERTDLPLGVTLESNIKSELTSAGLLIDGMVRAPKPDIVAAAFAVDVLGKRVDIAPEIVWEALSGDIEGGMERFGRLCWDAEIVLGLQQPRLSDWLASTVEDKPERCQQLESIFSEVILPRGWLKASVAVWKALAEQAGDDESRSRCLTNLSVDLANTGDHAGALEAIKDAVEILRRLAEDNPASFEPDLAQSLNNLSNGLSDTGNTAGALKAIKEAVEIRRRLAVDNPVRFELDLAQSLNNLSNRLSNAGDNTGALAAIKQGAEIYRRLAEDNPARFEPDLASSLNNLSSCLGDAGDDLRALEAINGAVEIHRRLAEDNPARFEPDLAGSLNNLSNRLISTGEKAEALKTIKEAVEIYCRLAEDNPARFEPDLAGSLNNLSNRLSSTGDNAGALEAIKEAVEIRRRLAEDNPARFEPDLARSLGVAGTVLRAMCRRAEAAEAFREAIILLRPYVERFPGSPHERLLKHLQEMLDNLELE